MRSLSALFESKRMVLSAHRGASYQFPENTIPAMEQAVKCGADFIEFDLRSTRDGIPVVLHDATIDRTSNGFGRPEDYTLAELREFNFSFFRHFARRNEPIYPELAIPTFEELLALFRGRVCMNIQVYLDNPAAQKEVCRLYREYDMYDQGYLTIADVATADTYRVLDPDVAFCLTPGWHERAGTENLKLCAAYGCRFVQPTAESVTQETFALCDELGLKANVFFADEPEDFQRLAALGAHGMMTNKIESAHLFFEKMFKTSVAK